MSSPRPSRFSGESQFFESLERATQLPARALLVADAMNDGNPADADAGALLHFKSMMTGEGLPCDLARLCSDRLYAYQRIAAAHATASEPLRRLALELFQIYHRHEAYAPSRR